MASLRILVAEDNELISELLGELLVSMGHVVCGREATMAGMVQAAVRLRPELMIVDHHLTAGSGIDGVDTVLRNGFIPHILVSGNIAAVKAIKPDAITLAKPYTAADLNLAIDRAIARTG